VDECTVGPVINPDTLSGYLLRIGAEGCMTQPHQFGRPDMTITGVAVHAGGVVVVGHAGAGFPFANDLVDAGAHFVLGFGVDLGEDWAANLTGAGGVLVDARGTAISVAVITNSVFDYYPPEDQGAHLDTPDGTDSVVLTLGSNGGVLARHALTGPGDQVVAAHAVDDLGKLVLAGYFTNQIDLGQGVIDSTAGGPDAFVQIVSGTAKTGHRLGGVGQQFADAVRWLNDGTVVVAGRYSDDLDLFGNQLPVSANTNVYNGFLARLDLCGP
jgi:hypothetical protein